jgi:competence protein ComEC
LRKTSPYAWEELPLLRIAVPFGVGISLYHSFDGLHLSLLALTVLAFSLTFIVHVRSTSYVFAFVVIGFLHTRMSDHRRAPSHFLHLISEAKQELVLVIASDPIQGRSALRFEAHVIAMHLSNSWQRTTGDLLVNIGADESANSLSFGDTLLVRGSIDSVPRAFYPGGFDYRAYLEGRRVYMRTYVSPANWCRQAIGRGLQHEIFLWRKEAMRLLEQQVPYEESRAVIQALLFGYKADLSADQRAAFAQAGAMHVLAVSGLHVGVVFLVMQFVLELLGTGRWAKVLRLIGLLSGLWTFVLFAGGSPSVVRAALMCSFALMATKKSPRSILQAIVFSAVVLLTWNPFYLLDVGFQLSYVAVLGIVYLSPRVTSIWHPATVILKKPWELMAVSIAAQVMTFPLALLYFHQFPNYFLLTNLIAIPMASIILPMGIASYALVWIDAVNPYTFGMLHHCVVLFNEAINLIHRLPYASLNGVWISPWQCAALYALVLALMRWWWTKRIRWFMIAGVLGAMLAIPLPNHGKFFRLYGYQNDIAIECSAHQWGRVFSSMDTHTMTDLLDDRRNQGVDCAHSPALPQVVGCDGKSVLLLEDDSHDTLASADVLVVHGKLRYPPMVWIRNACPSTVVLSSKVPFYQRFAWKEACEDDVILRDMRYGHVVINR